MQFIPYPSIPNLYNAKKVVKEVEEQAVCQEFYVTEKIHGANFGIYCDGEEIRCASRSGFIEYGQKFNNYQNIMDKYRANLIEFADRHIKDFKSFGLTGEAYMVFWCEIFGGSTQKNMPYSDTKDIRMFDAVLVCENTPENRFFLENSGEWFYQHQEHKDKIIITGCDRFEMFDLVEAEIGIKSAPILFRGSLQECMDFDINFASELLCPEAMSKYNLPEDHPEYVTRAITEGVVIQQVYPQVYFGQWTFAVKNKTSKFEEKKRVVKVEKSQQDRIDALSSPEAQDAMTHLLALVTQSRLDSVLSKLPDAQDLTIKDFNRVLSAFMEDLFDSFQTDIEAFSYEHRVEQYGVPTFKCFAEHKQMQMIVVGEANALVRNHLLGRNIND